MPRTKNRAQIGIEDNIIDDPQLEKLLDEREELKGPASDYRKANKKAVDAIKAKGAEGPFRCGRYLITPTKTESQDVSFVRNEGIRFNIKNMDRPEG